MLEMIANDDQLGIVLGEFVIIKIAVTKRKMCKWLVPIWSVS